MPLPRLLRLSIWTTSIGVLILALTAAGWATWCDQRWDRRLTFGDSSLFGKRVGVDFRVEVSKSEYAVPFLCGDVDWDPVLKKSEADRIDAEDRSWGGAEHWLKVPSFQLSLWWLTGVSLAYPVACLCVRRRSGRGFAVSPSPRAA